MRLFNYEMPAEEIQKYAEIVPASEDLPFLKVRRNVVSTVI